jgi:2,3,4,5-tetrahydropyridine-2,6-dicarboxylate N-succinyltransferase
VGRLWGGDPHDAAEPRHKRDPRARSGASTRGRNVTGGGGEQPDRRRGVLPHGGLVGYSVGMSESELRGLVEAAFEDRKLLEQNEHRVAVLEAVALLDAGKIRVATEDAPGKWTTHAWVKQAVLLYFAVSEMKLMAAGPFEFYDKVPLKQGLDRAGVRVVPPGTVRYGAFVEAGAVIMPGYVNIGAYVGARTMVDTWATVGSCAQIGKDCHLSGGVGIGGVLEPPGAQPVIIEDGCFIGSRAIIVEGTLIEREAVIGAGVTLTASTAIVDVTGAEPVELRRRVPARSVVIPGMRTKRFPAGEYQVPCALIIGKRTESTDKKTTLNAALRDFNVAV